MAKNRIKALAIPTPVQKLIESHLRATRMSGKIKGKSGENEHDFTDVSENQGIFSHFWLPYSMFLNIFILLEATFFQVHLI